MKISNAKPLLTAIIILIIMLSIAAVIKLTVGQSMSLLSTITGKHSVLRNKDLDKVADDQLVTTVMDWMWGKFNRDWSDQYEVISSLPKACQDIYSTFTIECEVNNGGFNQCYYNSSKDFTQMAEEGFKAIKAAGFADIMSRANSTYAEIKDDLEKQDDGTLESFSKSYENNPLNELDTEFYAMYEKESLEQLYIDYIRANVQYFGD
jgi:hypothetical protein